MRFSRNAAFRHGRLEQVSRDFHNNSFVIRFRVGGEYFFTNLLQFSEPDELFEKLKNVETGHEVFLGAHELDDGSYWLHWLEAPGVFELTPAPPQETTAAARDKLAFWGCATLGCLIAGIVGVLGGASAGSVLISSVLFVGLVVCGIVTFDQIIAVLHNGGELNRIMYHGFESLQKSLREGRAWNVSGSEAPIAAKSPPTPEELPDGVDFCRIDHAYTQQQIIRRPAGRSTVAIDYLIYNFICDGQTVSWPVRDETCVSLDTPAFRRRHPSFLSEGDQVIVYCADSPGGLAGFLNRYGLPALDGKPVLELCNFTDGTVYHSETDHCGSLPLLYIGAGLLVGVMAVLCGIVAVLQTSEPWFLPAALDVLKFVAFAIPCGILTMGVVLLLMELVLAIGDGDPEIAAGRKRWREAVTILKKQALTSRRGSPYWVRLWEWRIWALLGLMAIAGICLSLWFFTD